MEKMMVTVTARQSFDHDGKRMPGDQFEVSEQHAKQLACKGLIDTWSNDSADPQEAAGEPSSASQAAQASRRTTAKRSGRGARGRKIEG
ncbi:hypothetical protein CAL13_08835 [Bordetella genomosp. 9]|uniref:Uncharacterized protein n=1 Tax=Bordetella genomosp. 9 TaxID=1416803 RepID=A0A1W6YZ76_9BORD|nr:hypothetical protein CAL13_08835 [Bordetella genomosp. 9]